MDLFSFKNSIDKCNIAIFIWYLLSQVLKSIGLKNWFFQRKIYDSSLYNWKSLQIGVFKNFLRKYLKKKYFELVSIYNLKSYQVLIFFYN